MSETVQIASLKDDGTIPAYVARPAGTAKGAVIVIPEIFGVNPGIRQKADKWAEQGYLAVAPDIFWRFAPGVELNPDVEAELNEAFGYFQRYDPADGVYDIESTIRWIRAEGNDARWQRETMQGSQSLPQLVLESAERWRGHVPATAADAWIATG